VSVGHGCAPGSCMLLLLVLLLLLPAVAAPIGAAGT
jgi:hypothetical protein